MCKCVAALLLLVAAAATAQSTNPFAKVVPPLSREDNQRVEYSNLRYQRDYIAPSPQREQVSGILSEMERAYARNELDQVDVLARRAHQVLLNAPRVEDEKMPPIRLAPRTVKRNDEVPEAIVEFVEANNLWDDTHHRLRTPRNIPSLRTELRYAIDLYTAGGRANIARADTIVETTLSGQHLLRGSRFYGNFYPAGYEDFPPENDMFLYALLSHLARHCANEMPPALRARFLAALHETVRGLADNWYPAKEELHNIGHTNYYLMYLEGLLLLGEVTGDRAAVEKGERAFDVWIDFVAQNGITEFNSPTYYGVDARSLEDILHEASSARVKEKARASLDLLFTDMAALYVPEKGWLSGASSRNYSVMGGIGGGAGLFARLLQPDEVTYRADDIDAFPIYFDYTLPADIRALALEKRPFTFEAHWGPQYAQDRYTYATRDFIFGTGGSEYGSQDKPLVIDLLHNAAKLPSLVAVVDTQDNPYQLPKRGAWSGENHDPTGFTTVQDHGTALIVYDLDLHSAGLQRSYVAPTFAFPSAIDEIRIGGKPLSTADRAGKIPVAPGVPVLLRAGNVAIALHAVPGSPPAFLQFDGPVMIRELKQSVPMARFLELVYAGPEAVLPKDNVMAGFAIEMIAGTAAEIAQFFADASRARFDVRDYGARKTIQFVRGDARLGLERDFAKNMILNRWIGDRPFAPRAFHSIADLR